MDSPAAPKFLFLFLLSILIVCSIGVFLSPVKDIEQQQLQIEHQIFHSSRRELLTKTILHDVVNFLTSNSPTSQVVTNPVTVTVPPSPAIITVPSATPVTVTPTPPTPSTNPTTSPPAPITNPVTPPTTNNNPPVVAPPVTAGQSWCVAKSGGPAASVQAALDYACGNGADCAAIQQGASCYNPNTLQNHASYAFNSYYQRHPVQTSCEFGGAAVVTNVNPSSGSCTYPTLSSSTSPSTAPPTTTPATTPMTPTPMTPTTPTPTPTTPTTPMTPTPTTASSSGSSATPPTILNGNNPALGGTGLGESPPTTSTTSISMSSSLQQPFIGCIILVASIITGLTVLDI